MPYRTEASVSDWSQQSEKPPWWHRALFRVFVRLRLMRRFAARSESEEPSLSETYWFHGRKNTFDAGPSYNNLGDALLDLQAARDTGSLVGAPICKYFIYDRVTGEEYRPSPERIMAIKEHCPICHMKTEDPCNAGLHS